MNKILIVGMGWVGGTIARYHQKLGDTVYILDLARGYPMMPGGYGELDAIFFCLPSPSTDTGHADTSALESRLQDLWNLGYQDIPFICKTTAPPTVYARLSELYPNLVHVPEFLRQVSSDWDYRNPAVKIIGHSAGNAKYATAAMGVIDPGMNIMDGLNWVVMTNPEAALYKYISNAFLATKVTLMNEMHAVAQQIGADWNNLVFAMDHDWRIGGTHTEVPGPDGKFGWAGACFPKDIRAIIAEAEDLGCAPDLLKNVELINQTHRKRND